MRFSLSESGNLFLQKLLDLEIAGTIASDVLLGADDVEARLYCQRCQWCHFTILDGWRLTDRGRLVLAAATSMERRA